MRGERCVTISLWLHDKPRCQGGLCLVNIQQGRFKRHIVCQASTLGRAFSLESLSFISDFPGSGIGGYIITFIQVKLRKGCLSFFSSRLPDSPPWILKTFSWLIYMLTSRLPGELLFLDQKILIKKRIPVTTPHTPFSPWGLTRRVIQWTTDLWHPICVMAPNTCVVRVTNDGGAAATCRGWKRRSVTSQHWCKK